MNGIVNLDMDVLRTFVLGFELGSFARAAAACGRSELGWQYTPVVRAA